MVMHPFSRRRFMKSLSTASAAMAFPASILHDPYAPLARPRPRSTPIRVRGVVRSNGQGLIDVGVSDGRTVTRTSTDGTFEIITDSRQRFIHVSTPGGYEIGRHETGTARFYQPLEPNAEGEAEATFDLTPRAERNVDHAFLVWADTQTQNDFEMRLLHQQTVPDTVKTIGRLGEQELFGVACGDIMFDDLTLYPEYERAVQQLGIPFFQVIGNHDLDLEATTDEASTRTYMERFGPRYYSFDRGLVHYVVLDDVLYYSQGYIGYLDDIQLEWLAQDLSHIEAGRPVVVFAHIPGLSTRSRREGEGNASISTSITNRQHLYRLLEGYQAHLISGHTHENEHVFEGGLHEHVHGTVCGAWWSGPICYDGTPNGYGVYEVNGEQLTWRYKSTGYDDNFQMRVYPPGSDPTAPNEIVANVWDADPEWRIVWIEDGVQKGSMSNRIGKDPMSVELHTGPNLPERRPWVEPAMTSHLYYAPVSPQAREVIVEATDRFGHTFSTALTLE
jgi:hypothetical protein